MPIVDTAVQLATEHPVAAVAVAATAATAAYIVQSSDPKLVPDLPGPRGWPVVGSFLSRGFDPAETYRQWSKIYGPVFRHRLGSQWVVVINSADAADEIMASPKFATALQSRPMPYSFIKLLEDDPRTITVASSPYSELQKKKRLLAIEVCEPAVLHCYDDAIAWCCKRMVREIWEAAQKNDGVVEVIPIIRQLARNLSNGIHFGTTIEESTAAYKMKKPMRALNYFRSVHGRARDYLPWLQWRFLPEEPVFNDAIIAARCRNEALDQLVTLCEKRFADGELNDCAMKIMLENEKNKLTHDQYVSLSSSMISSGVDWHMSNTQLWGIAALAKDPEVQRKAFDSVLRRKTLPELHDVEHDHDDYVTALVKEVNRYYDALRIPPPRETIGKDIVWQGHYIPAGTTFYLNSYAINRDETRFSDPDTFKPERYMKGVEAERSLPNYSFGLGRRNCPAMLLAHKEIYATFSTIVEWFDFDRYDGEMEFDPVGANDSPYQFNQGPKEFRLKFRPRDQAKLEAFLATSDYTKA